MTAPKSTAEQAADLLLYAPIGFAADVRSLLPTLAERGRAQVQMARMIGQFAVKQGQVELDKRVEHAVDLLGELGLGDLFRGRGAGSASAPPAPAAPAPKAAPAAVAAPPKPTGPAAATLAIADYDSLAASQVVPRLAGLDADELEQVRRYEAAHRGRKTILGKIAQLQDA